MIMTFSVNLSKQYVMKAVQVLVHSGSVGEENGLFTSLDVVQLMVIFSTALHILALAGSTNQAAGAARLLSKQWARSTLDSLKRTPQVREIFEFILTNCRHDCREVTLDLPAVMSASM